MGVRWLRGRHDFVTEAPVVNMADSARIVMLGDWGSGIERAQKVPVQMRNYIDEGADERREVHMVHLGDVYYSGWRREYEKRFLPYCPSCQAGQGHSQTRPLIFLNACKAGQSVPGLFGGGGLASVFIDLGAGAVIAPLWSVKDTIAHEIALTFYGGKSNRKCPTRRDSAAATRQSLRSGDRRRYLRG